MAAPVIAVVAKKAATILLTDKRTWTVIGSIIGAMVAFIIIAVTVIFGGISAHNTAVEEGNAAMHEGLNNVFEGGALPENMPVEYKDGITKLKTTLDNIESEMKNQTPDADPLKAQVFFICLLTASAGDENFCADFVSCFAGAENDGQIFDNITAKFGLELSEDDRAHILSLYEKALESMPAPTESDAENSQ